MPRTLNANLLAELDARNFAKPIIRGWFGIDGAHDVQATVLKYTKTSTTISADVYGVSLEGVGYDSFTIERGLEINGIEYTIFSCHFFITAWNRIEKIFHIQGQLFNEREYTSAGDTTYGDAITTWLLTCTPGGFTPTFQNPLASWLSYQFLATGKNISLNRNTQFPPLLKQKYLAYIADYQDSTPIIFSTEDTFNRSTDWTISITDKDTFDESVIQKRFRWVDEVGTYHTSSATGSVHNLGYLESTASPPTARPAPFGSLAGQMYGEHIKVTLPFHLKYLTGDKVNFFSFTGYEGVLDVTEILDPEAEIAWRIELTPLVYLTNTDGGTMPSTIERVSNYTPINTTGFNGTLDSTINNLQAFADKVDSLVMGNMLKSTYDTDNDGIVDNAELLQGYAASAFAVAAKGVTNGDSHDHNGGDGAQIAHGNLSSIGTNTHAQIDTHLASTSNPHSTTPAQIGAIPNDGWIAISATGTSGTLDSPSFEISFNADMTALIGLGDRIKITQSTTKYFIVTKVGAYSAGATIITCYGGTDYTLIASGTTAITNPYYSHVKSPVGFPVDPAKWTVSASNSNRCQKLTPTVSTWYGDTGLSSTGPNISVPIGAWRGYMKAVLQTVDTTVTDYNCYMTLSTGSTTESDTDNTVFVAITVPSGTYKLFNIGAVNVKIILTSKTTYYINIKTTTSTADEIDIRGDVVPTIIKLVSDYL